ncbi:MAG: tRNA dihydrouridine(20/20a) synthase DusA [Tatlockia sp.]|nr:tRNA dihydrouridine(20/20a) synthase DusA [Tatlockia sp.]
MIDWTYTHFRVLMRLLAPHALLYTEMQTIGAIVNNPSRALAFQAIEHPLALQLGGADSSGLVHCAKLAEDLGFAEINLNLGCPSDKVLAGRFGACLMAEPEQVADCIKTLKAAVTIPVTAKTRIGIDSQDSYEYFSTFAKKLINAGCDKLIVHARKAWLSGLNPKQNRTIPPLHYDYVYQIKNEMPTLPVVINGNINTINEIEHHMQSVDGIMLGRLVCQNPYALSEIHHYYYPNVAKRSRHAILTDYLLYAEQQFEQNVPLSLLLKPIFNMAHGLPGAKKWKEQLVQIQQRKNPEGLKILINQIAQMEELELLN